MATLTIRNVEPALQKRLRLRAARNGHSMEAELRQILRTALRGEPEADEVNVAEAIRRLVAPLGGIDLEPHPPAPVREPPEFDN